MEPVSRKDHLHLGAAEVLALAASYRHALLNHLQVVSGWLQLGQVGRAEEYIGSLRESLNAETGLVRAAAARVAALLLMKRGVAENFGIEIRYDMADGLRGLDWPPEIGTLVGHLIDAGITLLHRFGQGKHLDVVLGGDEDAWCIGLVLDGCVLPEKRFEDSLAAALRLQGNPFDLRLARRRLRDAGGKWKVMRRARAIRLCLHWPRLAAGD